MTNIDYVRQLLDGFRADPNIRWLHGVPVGTDGQMNQQANLAAQYMSMYDVRPNQAPSWDDFVRYSGQAPAADIYAGTTYNSSTGAPMPLIRTPGQTGTSPYSGGTTGGTTPQTGGSSPPTGGVSPPNWGTPSTGGSNTGGTNTGGGVNTGSGTNTGGGMLGGWNFGRNYAPNNPDLAASVGTAPIGLTANPWVLGGNFAGTTRPPLSVGGYENWSASNPRAQNPGQVTLRNGDRFTPRQRVDHYGTGISLPWNNSFQQYGLSLALGNPVMPTFPHLGRRNTSGGQ